jgi:hypothetical protein
LEKKLRNLGHILVSYYTGSIHRMYMFSKLNSVKLSSRNVQ